MKLLNNILNKYFHVLQENVKLSIAICTIIIVGIIGNYFHE